VLTPENNDNEGQSHGLSELDVVDCEYEIPNNKCALAVLKISTRQKRICQEIYRSFYYIL